MMGRWYAVLVVVLVLCVSVHAANQISDDEKLATLASRMLNLTQDIGRGDYTMDCGPAAEIINTKPTALRSTHYCVLVTSTKTIIGTFDDPAAANIRQLMLRAYNDTQFYSQVDIRGIKPTACDGKGLNAFEECIGAVTPRAGTPTLPTMYTYVYDDEITSGAIYLLISDQQLNSVRNTKTFFGQIDEFFKGMFG